MHYSGLRAPGRGPGLDVVGRWRDPRETRVISVRFRVSGDESKAGINNRIAIALAPA
jgi:hypothetical protein